MTYIVMTSAVCCADAFSVGKSRRNREITRSEQSDEKQTCPARQVSRISNAKATVRYETRCACARKRIRRFLQVDFSRLPSDFHICGQGHLRQAA